MINGFHEMDIQTKTKDKRRLNGFQGLKWCRIYVLGFRVLKKKEHENFTKSWDMRWKMIMSLSTFRTSFFLQKKQQLQEDSFV